MSASVHFLNGRSIGIGPIPALALFAGLILLPNVILLSRGSIFGEEFVLPFAVNLSLLLMFLALHSRIWIGVLLLTPFAILAPVESSYIWAYGRPSDAHLLGILGESNLTEARDFLQGIGFRVVILAIAALMYSALVTVLASRMDWRWQGRTRIWILTAGLLGAGILAAQDAPALQTMEYMTEAGNIRDKMLVDVDSSLSAKQLMESYPAGVPFRLASFVRARNGLLDATSALRDFRFGAVQEASANSREVYVLVIGETGRPDRWQLNGYARRTNPRLAKIDNVTSFTNVTTPWAWTRMSVPIILTRKPAHETHAFFAEKSLIAAFREAGFRTYWLSTQSPLGPHDSSIALHAKEADEVHFLNPADYRGRGILDGALLEPFRKVLAKNENRQLIVLHTLGSHYSYADRYPDEFDVFRPSQKGRKDASLHHRRQKAELNNSYDNSVLYTDYLLAEVIERLVASGSQSSLLYIADHGENLFDGVCDKSGHGHATERDFRVASIWWNSPSYTSANPEKAALLQQRRDVPMTTSHVFHTLLDAASIRYPEEDLSRSLLRTNWSPRPRWTQTGLDFDTAARDPICKTLTARPTY
jgi:glucan phosphoethanolaminetransferase (alkaline phosphatase superfamily)